MDKEFRSKFNEQFTLEKYHDLLNYINHVSYYPVDFRIAETPVFLTKEFTGELISAAYDIARQLKTPDFLKHAETAVPGHLEVPGEGPHPLFLQIDFAVCTDDNGNYIPQLIELQAFPTVYCFQYFLNRAYRSVFDIPAGTDPYFSGLDEPSYTEKLKQAIVGNADLENTILLEIEPGKQKTRIDFACTEKLIAIKTVSVTDVIKKGKKLYYRFNEKDIPVDRIYNRVIFDELERKNNLNLNFSFSDDLEVEWAGHPNWFFKISKHTLPFLKGKYVPECYFLDSLEEYPDNLTEYVLKPLYSFAGGGVQINVTEEMLNNLNNRPDYILQKKVNYAPFIKTPDGDAKCEIRMMFLWQEEPLLVNNLVRISKGEMMGVGFNKDKSWVGSSLAYHP